MTRYCAWLSGVVDDLRKPLNKDEYRAFGRVKGGSPSCDREGVTGEMLTRGGIKVIRVG